MTLNEARNGRQRSFFFMFSPGEDDMGALAGRELPCWTAAYHALDET
jgi:hypothetical protein